MAVTCNLRGHMFISSLNPWTPLVQELPWHFSAGRGRTPTNRKPMPQSYSVPIHDIHNLERESDPRRAKAWVLRMPTGYGEY